MATQKRKATKGKPITSHPLFPAVVALWFGALFGLGSLAVRASLLESLVIKSRIDLIVPAAAPPLGLTARMLVALALAALGAVLGAVIARRVTRPKPAAYQRRREARSAQKEDYSIRTLDPDAAPLDPVAVSYGDASVDDADAGSLASRRRPLAIHHEEVAYVPHELAPLPGGQPQILDIAGMNLGEPMGTATASFAAPYQAQAQESADLSAPVDNQPLDLGSFAQSVDPQPSPQPAPSLNWSQAKPVTADANAPFSRPVPDMIEQQRQMFQPGEPALPAMPAMPAQDPHRQVFGQAPVEPATFETSEAELPEIVAGARQMFGQTATDDHVPGEFVEALGYRTTVFDTPEVQPLFPAREEAREAAAPSFQMPEIAPFEAPVSQADAAPFAAPASEASAAAEIAVAPTLVEPVAALEVAPEPQEPLPDPASLGMTELAMRLGESMRRRRAARAAAAASAATTAVAAALAEASPVPTFEAEQAPPVGEEPLAETVAEPFAEPVAETVAEPFAEPVAETVDETDLVIPPPYVPPFAHIEPIDEPISPPFARLPGLAAEPAVAEPFEVTVDLIEAVVADAVEVPPAPLAMPAALRPISFDDFDDEDADSMLDSLLPPRSLGTHEPEAAPAPAMPEAEALEADTSQAETIEAEFEAEAAADEEGYGSLLDLGPAAVRNPFVRIDEPEAAGDAIEPVVIFPGQVARQQFTPPAAPRQVPLGEDDPSRFRRFDAPNQAEQGQMVAAPGQNPHADPEEAERALRTALANLQRISGAA